MSSARLRLWSASPGTDWRAALAAEWFNDLPAIEEQGRLGAIMRD
jgi:hypothetical protein